jgi:hypothetical protein
MPELMAEHPGLSAPVPVLEPQEADARYDMLCRWYFGRELHEHTAVRRRTLGLLADAACMSWSWGGVQNHCGLSANFLTLVCEGLRDGAAAAIARAEQEGRGSLVRGEAGGGDHRCTMEAEAS